MSISYTGVILDEESHAHLIDKFVQTFPGLRHWKTIAHHCTVCLGPCPPDMTRFKDRWINLRAIRIGVSDMAIAVEVDGITSDNKITHVTIAINAAKGAKPMMSNQITKWYPIAPLPLKGKFMEVKNG